MLRQLLLACLGAYLLLLFFAFFFQRGFTYFPDNTPFSDCRAFSSDEMVVFDGVRMYVRGDSERVLVVYHGNAGRACDRAHMERFTSRSLVFVEYPGYAGDGMLPSEERFLATVRSVDGYLSDRGVLDVAVLGESLGCSSAAYHASLGGVDRLVLVAPFPSLRDVASGHYWFFPVRWLLREEHAVLSRLDGFGGELLLVHGSHDKVVPARHSEGFPGRRVLVPGAGHNNIYSYELVDDELSDFLR